MNTVALNIPESLIKHAMSATGKRTARAAVLDILEKNKAKAEQIARLEKEYPRPHMPNAETIRALRSKAKGKTFTSAKAAMAYLDSL